LWEVRRINWTYNGLYVEVARVLVAAPKPKWAGSGPIVAHLERILMARQQNNLILEVDWNH